MQPVVLAQGLCKRFGSIRAVSDVSFQVASGSITALLGGNGAGKTTTIAMLLGLLVPTAGQIQILGENMLRHRHRVLPRMNFSSPYVDLPQRLTVWENLSVYSRLYGVRHRKERILELAEELDLKQFLDRPYRSLSAGQRTRVALAKSMLNQPELLLLDEPTASLDPDTADRLRRYLMDYRDRTGGSMLLASHNMREVEQLCDHAVVMRAGEVVVEGSPDALMQRFGRGDMEAVFLDIAREGAD
ncbi:MAG: ABC transporter ATP-binding protein [Pseudomonadota bacterium]|nr:ABC transporter ATP-binding protein [Pseudomonadota bacterium]